MSDKQEVRTAAADDLPSLLALYQHLDPDNGNLDLATAEGLLADLDRYPGSAVLVCFCDGRMASSCTLVVIPNLTRGGTPYALIENVVTDPDFRKRGFGKAILQGAVERAWAADCYKLMLMTGSKRPETLRFYEGVGFEQSKTGFQVRRIPARPD